MAPLAILDLEFELLVDREVRAEVVVQQPAVDFFETLESDRIAALLEEAEAVLTPAGRA